MSGARVYRISPLRRWLLWLVIGPILAFLLVLAVTGDAAERRAMLATAGLVFLIALPFEFLVRRTRLELSEEGVRLHQAGYRLAAIWADIETLDLTPRREGFVTRAPMTGRGSTRLARFRFAGTGTAPLYDAAQQALLAEQRLIPIEAFAWHLRRGSMGQDIALFAPQLATALAAN